MNYTAEDKRHYLGGGVYVRLDEWGFWLSRNQPDNEVIYLAWSTLRQLVVLARDEGGEDL